MLLALYMFGIGKAAVMPMHFWLPAAMVAPTPVSALLHAVAVVKAGVFTIVKVVVYVFGVDDARRPAARDWLVSVAGFTIIAASLIALRADNLKRRLAYSTVSQLSYVVLGAALLTPLSIIGAALHIAAHALGKITLFFAAGAIYTAAHMTEVSELDGIGRRMPWTMGAFAVGALSMIGMPPAAGFLGKWFMLSGAMAAGALVGGGVIVVSTLLNAGYFLPIVYRASSAAPRPEDRDASARRGAAADRGRAGGDRCRLRGPVLPARGAARAGAADAGESHEPATTHWLDEPRNVKRLWRGFLARACADGRCRIWSSTLHPHFAIEALLGFDAWYGFLACAAMIVVAKALGVLLKRPDTYYETNDE